jgi:hypothetical protein
MKTLNTLVSELLKGLKKQFITKLDKQCIVFKTVGSIEESPRWFQYRSDKNEEGILYIGHSQCNYMFMKIDISMLSDTEQLLLQNHYNQEVYDFFKEVKYNHLREYHPTIDI